MIAERCFHYSELLPGICFKLTRDYKHQYCAKVVPSYTTLAFITLECWLASLWKYKHQYWGKVAPSFTTPAQPYPDIVLTYHARRLKPSLLWSAGWHHCGSTNTNIRLKLSHRLRRWPSSPWSAGGHHWGSTNTNIGVRLDHRLRQRPSLDTISAQRMIISDRSFFTLQCCLASLGKYKHQYWGKVGPSSTTPAQPCDNIGLTYNDFREKLH